MPRRAATLLSRAGLFAALSVALALLQGVHGQGILIPGPGVAAPPQAPRPPFVASPPSPPVVAALPPPRPPVAFNADVNALLAQRDNITNWFAFAQSNNITGWNEVTNVCEWSGVVCSSNGLVTTLRLHTCLEFDNEDLCNDTANANNAAGIFFRGLQAQGSLSASLADLQTVEVIDIYRQEIRGALPNEWGQDGTFKRLTSLNLFYNNLTGTLPASWGSRYAFPELREVFLDDNRLNGTLPPEWGTQGGFHKLEKLHLDDCQMDGSLPNEWGEPAAFPQLRELVLFGNQFTGTLPDSWSNIEDLETLRLHNNPFLTGTIPLSWANLPLKEFTLDGTEITGCVPDKLASVARFCKANSTGPCPRALPPCGDSTASSGSSVPIGAIVGGVIGGVVLLALAGFLLLRYRKRKASAAAGGAAAQLPPELGKPSSSATESLPPKSSTAYPGTPSKLDPELDTFVHQPPTAYTSQNASFLSGYGMTTAPPATHSGSVNSLGSDPLVSYINSHLSAAQRAAAQGSGGGGALQRNSARMSGELPRGSALGAELEVHWEDLQLARPIGSGSFGRVYLARWRCTEVAVKVLIDRDGFGGTGSLALPESMMRALQEEVRVMYDMRHPNVVALMGLCTLPACIITEYCKRGSLYDVLRQASREPAVAAELTWQRRLQMAIDSATGMLYLHEKGIIHRDVKSPNLLVGRHWEVKVADFNLAKVLMDNPESTGAATSMGGVANPIWLAPEVLTGEKSSAASDVYSFGLVLWELLTWQLPHAGLPPFKVMQLTMSGQRPPIPPYEALPGPGSATFAGLDAYCRLIKECWATDPASRPPFATIISRLEELAALAGQ